MHINLNFTPLENFAFVKTGKGKLNLQFTLPKGPWGSKGSLRVSGHFHYIFHDGKIWFSGFSV